MAKSNPAIDLTLDYHAHILPRCDHGSDGVETSLRQLAMAADVGIRTVCATPHFYPHRENAAAFLERRARCAAALPRRPELPRILLGAEVLICDGMERLDDLPRLCLEGTNELLLEMPFYAWPSSLWDTLFALCERRDIRIVLAHADRYPKENIERLIREGIPAQCRLPDEADQTQTISGMDPKRLCQIPRERYPYAWRRLPGLEEMQNAFGKEATLREGTPIARHRNIAAARFNHHACL